MKKPEAEMYALSVKPVLDSLAGHLVYDRHEDRVTPGVPDISYASVGGGWIELKRIRRPRRDNGRAPIRHLTEQQIGFLLLRGKMGQGAWVLVQVDIEDPVKDRLFYLWGHWQLDQLRAPGIRYVLWQERAVKVWQGKIDARELLQILQGHTRGNRV